MSDEILKLVSTARSCDGCTACCQTHGVKTLKKEPGVWCQYCNQGVGCKIYTSRPKECRIFVCEWLKGFGGEELKPSRSGVVLDYIEQAEGLGKLFVVYEMRSSALTPQIWDLLGECIENEIWVLVIYLSGRRELFVPSGKRVTADIKRSAKLEGIEIKTFPIIGGG